MTTVIRFMRPSEGKSAAYVSSVIVGLLNGKTVVTNHDVLKLDLSDCALVTVIEGGRFNTMRLTNRAKFVKKYLEKELAGD